MEDCLTITYDCCSPDNASLCVARKEKDEIRVLNIIYGSEAVELYNKLRGIETYAVTKQKCEHDWVYIGLGEYMCNKCRARKYT